MSWEQYHSISEKYASSADVARFQRNIEQAQHFFRQAAEQEELALSAIDPSESRALGIIAVSAVALWYKASEFTHAYSLAAQWLEHPNLPTFAQIQLQELQEAIRELEKLKQELDELCCALPLSFSARELLTKAVAEWKGTTTSLMIS